MKDLFTQNVNDVSNIDSWLTNTFTKKTEDPYLKVYLHQSPDDRLPQLYKQKRLTFAYLP